MKMVKGSLPKSIGLNRAAHSAVAGLAIYSSYDPIKTESFVFSRDNGFQYADFRHENGKIFRVYNVHLLSNQITGMAYQISEGGTVPERKDMHLYRKMLSLYKQSIKNPLHANTRDGRVRLGVSGPRHRKKRARARPARRVPETRRNPVSYTANTHFYFRHDRCGHTGALRGHTSVESFVG